MKKEDFLALGLTEEQAEKAATASAEELKGFIPKSRFDEVNAAKKQADESLKNYEKQLNDLKKASEGNDELKAQIETLQNQKTATKEQYEEKVKQLQIDGAVERALIQSGAKNVKAARALLELKEAGLEGDTVKGLAEQIEKLKASEDSAFLFKEAGEVVLKGVTPGEKSDPGIPDFSKMSYDEIEAYYNAAGK